MSIHPDEATQILRCTPAVLDALLRGQPGEWLDCNEGPGTFSPRDVLGHLLYGEMTDWIPRARIILESGESRAFEPFDRRGFESLIQDRPVEAVLDRFAELRGKNLEALGSLELDPRRLALTGMHPELGQVTMSQLLATWVVHDLGHLAQIGRAMSKRYKDAVGPWQAYLPILK